MKVSQVPKIYEAIQAAAENDDVFKKELTALYSDIAEENLSDIPDAKSLRIIDFLSEDDRIPLEQSNLNKPLWTSIIPVTITLLLCKQEEK